VLLSSVAGGFSRLVGERPDLPRKLRTAVPLMVRDPGAAAEANRTAAVMVDLPLGARDEHARLADVAGRTARLRTGSRALASRFVMQDIGELMPPPMHRWFSRTVYGRRFFAAIVSNMPGPDTQLNVRGARIDWAGPLLPLAPGSPLAIGALSWNGDLLVGITADPLLVPDAHALGQRIAEVLAELGGGQLQPRASSSSSRTSGSSSSAP
jgi:hypothetical protein